MKRAAVFSVAALAACWAFWRVLGQAMKNAGQWERMAALDGQERAVRALGDRLGSQAQAMALIHQTAGTRLEDNTPPESAVAVASRRWLATTMQQTQHEPEDSPMGQPLTDQDWEHARAHFFATMRRYQDLMGHPGIVVGPALATLFEPLARRFRAGERTRALYDAMLGVN